MCRSLDYQGADNAFGTVLRNRAEEYLKLWHGSGGTSDVTDGEHNIPEHHNTTTVSFHVQRREDAKADVAAQVAARQLLKLSNSCTLNDVVVRRSVALPQQTAATAQAQAAEVAFGNATNTARHAASQATTGTVWECFFLHTLADGCYIFTGPFAQNCPLD